MGWGQSWTYLKLNVIEGCCPSCCRFKSRKKVSLASYKDWVLRRFHCLADLIWCIVTPKPHDESPPLYTSKQVIHRQEKMGWSVSIDGRKTQTNNLISLFLWNNDFPTPGVRRASLFFSVSQVVGLVLSPSNLRLLKYVGELQKDLSNRQMDWLTGSLFYLVTKHRVVCCGTKRTQPKTDVAPRCGDGQRWNNEAQQQLSHLGNLHWIIILPRRYE